MLTVKKCIIRLVPLIGLFAGYSQASAPSPEQMIITQPNGESFTGVVRGSDWFHWIEKDEYVLFKSETGYYEYVELTADNELVSSGVRYEADKISADSAPSTLSADSFGRLKSNDESFTNNIKKLLLQKDKTFLEQSSIQADSVDGSAPGVYGAPGDTHDHGSLSRWAHVVFPPPQIPLFVVQIEFNDQQFRSTESVWHDKIFGYADGQMNHYWQTISKQSVEFVPVTESFGDSNDGIARIKLNVNHPNSGQDVEFSYRMQVLDIIDSNFDFSQYDADQDGQIGRHELAMFYVYSGGESSSGSNMPSVWGHATSDLSHVRDGVSLSNYSRVGERHGSEPSDRDATIGIIAHELGHSVFALPDLYDYDGSSGGIDNWGLMSYGSWNSRLGETIGAYPKPLSAWGRYRLGFIEATIAPAGQSNFVLDPVGLGGEAVLINYNPERPHEFFMVENRAQFSYDQSRTFYNDGLMIWHIDEIQYNNSRDDYRLVDVEEASLVSADSLWPTSEQNKFDRFSSPSNNKDHLQRYFDFSVEDIQRNNDGNKSVSFVVKNNPGVYSAQPIAHIKSTATNWSAEPMTLTTNSTWEIELDFPAQNNNEFIIDIFADGSLVYGKSQTCATCTYLVEGGQNVSVPGQGLHRISFNDSTRIFEIENISGTYLSNKPQMNVRGSFNGWGVTAMELVSDYEWQAIVTINPADSPIFKFDVFGDWSENYGDSNGDRQLDVSGNNIQINGGPGLAEYKISLFDDSMTYQITYLGAAGNQSPVADAGADVITVVGDNVELSASNSYDPDGTIVSYEWSNGQSGSEITVSFTEAGNYSLDLIVTDNGGLTSTDSVTVSVEADDGSYASNEPSMSMSGSFNGWAPGATPLVLVQDYTWEVELSLTQGDQFKFTPVNWSKSYGDNNGDGIADSNGGGNIVVNQPSGVYNVNFNDATLAYSIVPIAGGNLPPVARAGIDLTIQLGDTVTIDGSGSNDPDGTIVSWAWSSGDTSPSFSRTFDSVGQFNFELTVTDDDGATSSDTMTVTVEDIQTGFDSNHPSMSVTGSHNGWTIGSSAMQLIADFTWEIEVTLSQGDNFKFTPVDWSLSYGDNDGNGIADSNGGGNIAVNGSTGTYKVLFNDQTLSYSLQLLNGVNQAPEANAGDDQTVLVNQAVNFDGSASFDSDGSISTYAWSFGATNAVASHTYTTVGEYTETLTVTDNEGAVASDQITITVVDSLPSLQVTFTCNNAFTNNGETIKVVGNSAELGNWSPANGIEMNQVTNGQWKVTLDSVTPNSTVEWKCIKFNNGSVQWQGGGNNAISVGSEGDYQTSGQF